MAAHQTQGNPSHARRARLAQDKIQAYISEILIITNPFKRIPGLYDEEVMKQYKARRTHTCTAPMDTKCSLET